MSEPSVTVRRAPDGWTHIGGPGMHLLIALDEEDERTITASDAADGGDLDDVIDVLTAGGLRKSHHFVGVHWLPHTRIVAHGPVAATVTTTDGTEREIRAASPRVWTDVEFDEQPAKVDLRVLEESELATAPAPSGEPLIPPAAPRTVPTFGSVVDENASRVGRTWAGNWAAPSPSSDPTVHRTEPAKAVDDGITRVGGGLPPWGEARPRAVRQPVAAMPTEATPTSTAHSVLAAPAATPQTPAEPAARDIHSTWASRPSESTMREVPPAAPVTAHTEAWTRSPESVADDEPAAPSYDYLFGHTTMAEEHRKVLASLEAPADAEDEEQDEAIPSSCPEPPAARTRAVEEPSAPPPPPAQAVPTVHPEPTTGGLISSVPWASTSTSSPASAPTNDQPTPVPSFSGRHSPPPAPSLRPATPSPVVRGEDRPPRVEEYLDLNTSTEPPVPQTIAALPDDAELTVDRSALLQAAGGTGPTVMAVLCPAGHASPPHADRCRICGATVPQQEAFAMPRPPLGVLRLSTGDVVTLDRNVLLGRAPKPAPGLAPDAHPHVVRVPSPERDVSRNHVEVLVDGWHVLIRDLGTTNGTTVAFPGEAPLRLRAHDEQSLEPGSVVSMADEVSFTFEVGV